MEQNKAIQTHRYRDQISCYQRGRGWEEGKISEEGGQLYDEGR